MLSFFRHFIHSNDGAITVDWVAITAMGIAITLSVFGTIKSGSLDISNNISSTLSQSITTNF